jgi:hypothetical protein
MAKTRKRVVDRVFLDSKICGNSRSAQEVNFVTTVYYTFEVYGRLLTPMARIRFY